MENKVIYLRELPNQRYGWIHNPYFYKVSQQPNGDCKVVTVTENSIEVEEKEDFFDSVGFVKNTLCKENGCEEITRAQFDEFYKKTISLINKSTAA